MDGTGDLFEPLLASCPVQFEPHVVSYSRYQPQSYNQLVSEVADQLLSEPVVILAESFSGAVAIKLAAKIPERVKAIILCNAFVKSPAPSIARILPWSWLMARRPPGWLLRKYLVGPEALPEITDRVRAAIDSVSPLVLAARVHSILSEDVGASFRALPMPVFDLRARNDRLLSNRVVNQLRSLRPHDPNASIAGPHLLLQVQPERAWLEIHRFCTAL